MELFKKHHLGSVRKGKKRIMKKLKLMIKKWDELNGWNELNEWDGVERVQKTHTQMANSTFIE